MPTLRLLSYDVRSLRDDKRALARVIRSAEPDVVCIQRSPRLVRWRSRSAALARTGGLVVVSGGPPAGSNLILSTLGVDVLESSDVRFGAGPRQPGVALAVLRLRGATFAVAVTRLDHGGPTRPRQVPEPDRVAELQRAIAAHVPAEVAVIVAAGVEDGADSGDWRALAEHRPEALAAAGPAHPPTFPAAMPQQSVDGVFVDARITITSARVLEQADVILASDHRPVLVELELP